MRYTHLLRAVHALVYSSFQPGKNSLTMMLFSQKKKKKDSYFRLLVNGEWLELWIEIWKKSIYFTVLITKQRVFFLKKPSVWANSPLSQRVHKHDYKGQSQGRKPRRDLKQGLLKAAAPAVRDFPYKC